MASHVPCKSLLSVARILLAFLYTPLRHVAFMPLRCNELVSSKFQKLAFKKIRNRKPLIGNVVRVRRVYQLRVGLGRFGLGSDYLYQIPSQSGIIVYWNLDRVLAEYLHYFLYFLIYDINMYLIQICVWWTDLRHSGPGWEKLTAFLAENLTKLSASAHLQNFPTKMPYL